MRLAYSVRREFDCLPYRKGQKLTRVRDANCGDDVFLGWTIVSLPLWDRGRSETRTGRTIATRSAALTSSDQLGRAVRVRVGGRGMLSRDLMQIL